jgi:uncharacterized protein YndB with AHSA1/START domain
MKASVPTNSGIVGSLKSRKLIGLKMAKTIKQTYLMKATPARVFQALTDPKIIKTWSGAPAKMSAKKGASFRIWGGDMFGKNLEVVKNKKLVQEWNTPSFSSRVTFTIKPKGTGSMVELLHENVPPASVRSYADGWKRYYLGAMQEMFKNE